MVGPDELDAGRARFSANRGSRRQLVRRYRSPLSMTIGLSGAALGLIVGAAMVVPTSKADVSQYVVGGFVIAASCWAGSIIWTNCVLLTPRGS